MPSSSRMYSESPWITGGNSSSAPSKKRQPTRNGGATVGASEK
jgi:hypothetical protein